jgi:hypothetical protein
MGRVGSVCGRGPAVWAGAGGWKRDGAAGDDRDGVDGAAVGRVPPSVGTDAACRGIGAAAAGAVGAGAAFGAVGAAAAGCVTGAGAVPGAVGAGAGAGDVVGADAVGGADCAADPADVSPAAFTWNVALQRAQRARVPVAGMRAGSTRNTV